MDVGARLPLAGAEQVGWCSEQSSMKASGRPGAERQAPTTGTIAASSRSSGARKRRGGAAPAAPRLPVASALAQALGSAADAVTFLDRDWRIVFINQRSADLLGASRESLLGRNIWELYPGAGSGRAYTEFHRAMREQVSVVFEQLSPSVGRVLQCFALPTAAGLVVISRDASPSGAMSGAGTSPALGPSVRPIVVEALQSSERRFRALIENSLDAVLMIDACGHTLYASPRVFGEDGILPQDTLGLELLAHVHPEDAARARAEFVRVLAEPGATVSSSYRVRHRNGRWIWVEGIAHNRLHDPAVRAVVINCRDVTERHRAEDALRFSEQHFRSLIEGALDLVTVVDDAGKILYASPSHERVMGWSPDELVGRNTLDLVHPDDRALLVQDFEVSVATNASARPVEARIRHKDGSWRVIESIMHRSPAASPVGGFIANARDVSERKAAEQKTSTLLDLARDLASTLDGDELLDRVGRHVAAALPCELVSAFQWDELRGRYVVTSHFGLLQEWTGRMAELPEGSGPGFIARLAEGPIVIEDAEKARGLLGKVARQAGIKSIVAAPLRSTARHHGALIAATTRADRCFDGTHGELLAAIAGQLAVVRERADLYRQQQDDARLFGALARIGQELLAGFDRPDLPDRLCRVAAEVLDCTTAHTVAWRPEDDSYGVVAAHGAAPEVIEALRVVRIPRHVIGAALDTPGAGEVVQMVSGGPGCAELASVLGVPAGGHLLVVALRRGADVVGVQTALCNDPTAAFGAIQLKIAGGLAHLGSLALEHARAMDELNRANRLKSDFVAMISHELRTPLNVILGYCDLLLDETFGALQPAQADVLQSINASGHELLGLIRDVLDLSRLESGRIPLDLKEISIPDLVAELESGARSLERAGEVELRVDLDARLDKLVTDPAKLHVALKNLIANAFKFTPRGSVTLAVRAEEHGVAMTVADTGIGIPRDQLGIIFEPFRQGDPALTRRHGGVGLGLYIVRRLVEMLGGSVHVESRPGHGSTFRVWLPDNRHPVAVEIGRRGANATDDDASSDAITGLPSLTLLRDRLAHAMRTGEPRRSTGAVLLVALDLREALATGCTPGTREALLCMVGERLASVLRVTDTVARPGGDEFVALLPGRATGQTVARLAQMLLGTLSVDLLVDGLPRRVAATIGAVLARGGCTNPDAIIARARRAAQRARQSGRATDIEGDAPARR